MRLSRLFVGGYEEIRRPVIPVDESLVDRIAKARQRLAAEGKEVVSVRNVRRATANNAAGLCPRRIGGLGSEQHRQTLQPRRVAGRSSMQRRTAASRDAAVPLL